MTRQQTVRYLSLLATLRLMQHDDAAADGRDRRDEQEATPRRRRVLEQVSTPAGDNRVEDEAPSQSSKEVLRQARAGQRDR
jgi:hypothetical protein